MSDSLRPHESQHARPPCPSPTPGVHSDSRPSSQWCHPASHPLSSPSPPAPNPSQHQGLFQWVISLSVVSLFPYKFPVLPKPRTVNTGQVRALWSEWMSESTPLWMWPSRPSSSLPWNFGFLLQNETLDWMFPIVPANPHLGDSKDQLGERNLSWFTC